ncbi:MAG: site-2 protease family protein, partial [Pseudomonadota bacterium]
GDPTAHEKKRLSLNPLRHVDPVGTLLVPGGLALAGAPVFGWAKPVPVQPWRLNNPRYGMMAVAAAGPGTNFVLAAIGAIALGLLWPVMDVGTQTDPSLAVQALTYFILINVFLGMFNLLPIPPFDGSHIFEGLLPRSLAPYYAKLRPFGFMLFFALVAVTWFAPEWGVLEKTVMPPVEWAMRQYNGLATAVAG